MTRIAILGGTSQIARDLILELVAFDEYALSLYARRPDAVRAWLKSLPAKSLTAGTFEEFAATHDEFDAVINFVGSGNPAQVDQLGASILDITYEFDGLVLQYLKRHPGCRYIFLSSGAVYGGGFATPADDQTHASFPINQLGSQDWYGMAKIFAETRHRALAEFPIVDLRVFNYFSQSTDIQARFLITDILRSIKAGQVMQISQENIVRDYIGPKEFMQLILKVLIAPPQNVAIDCFTQAPVDKISILERMHIDLGLRYSLVEGHTGLLPTGSKLNYYSKSRKATEIFDYIPQSSSIEIIMQQSKLFLKNLTSP